MQLRSCRGKRREKKEGHLAWRGWGYRHLSGVKCVEVLVAQGGARVRNNGRCSAGRLMEKKKKLAMVVVTIIVIVTSKQMGWWRRLGRSWSQQRWGGSGWKGSGEREKRERIVSWEGKTGGGSLLANLGVDFLLF